jgi:8-oxo-dGTP pyrophosphatase MutT (NUDIX family)
MDLNKITQVTHAGVIVLYESSSQCVILTKRSSHLRKHPGEICFPGGSWEEDDENFYGTALRELHEELGIPSERVTLIRELSVERTLLGSIIHPWFAYIDYLEPCKINDCEVASIIRVPLSLVQNSIHFQEINMERHGIKFKSCQFLGHEEFIWGATARIMKQLSDKL